MDGGCFEGGGLIEKTRDKRDTKRGKKINAPEERRTRDAISGDVYDANVIKKRY